ncbi:MAG TPA: hypothetical protein VI756_22960 [Blastocatellia bacterium]
MSNEISVSVTRRVRLRGRGWAGKSIITVCLVPPLILALLALPVRPSLAKGAIVSGPALLSDAAEAAFSQSTQSGKSSWGQISNAEFSRLIGEFSEPGGSFLSDNLISNETSYLHVVPKLRELGATGGAYIGVGPEQNFTYIAKIHPNIAFIIDIRRQAIVQHLMFKAIFELAPTPPEFLSILLSRPLSGKAVPVKDPSLELFLDYFSKTPADSTAFKRNLGAISKLISGTFGFGMTAEDRAGLENIFTSFREDGLDISFSLGRSGYGDGFFPTLRQLIDERDLTGNQGNFLATRDDYEFVRRMQQQNRIIPVVGDFAGYKALSAIAGYLRQHHHVVTAFYLSNVEQYLFESGVFDKFAENVRKLPVNDKSLFIRSVFEMWVRHPARIPGHHSVTVLQSIQVFLKDYDDGRCGDYYNLVTNDYIAGN